MFPLWAQLLVIVPILAVIIGLICGMIYYRFFDKKKPKPDYRHISQMEHDAGLLPCSLSICATCYPQAVTGPPKGSLAYSYLPRRTSIMPSSLNEYNTNSLIQDAYNKEVEMAMRSKIYFDYDDLGRRVSVSNGTHAMIIDAQTLEAVGEEAVKDKFLADIKHDRNTKWEIERHQAPTIPTKTIRR
jgi:hypothetical protein